MLCILYVIAIGLCLGLAGLTVERVLPPSAARRWIWCVVIALSVGIPPVYQAKHVISVGDRLAQAPPGTASISSINSGWVARIQAFDAGINRFWLLASAALIVWALIGAWRVLQIVRASRRRQRDSVAPTIVDGVPVLVTDQVGPATVGFWRSRVLVPRWVLALPGVQRQYVIRHEEEHRRAHDGRLLFAASLLLILLPWNVALWWQLRRLRLAVELDCDNRVVKALGDPNAYGRLLLTVAQATSPGPRLQPAFLGGAGMLERRLTMLLAPTPLRHVQRYLLPALAIAILLLVLSMPHPVLRSSSAGHATANPSQVAGPQHQGSHQ
jgi:beta-lactamase regulating signal transducer with metallopeptidase domain